VTWRRGAPALRLCLLLPSSPVLRASLGAALPQRSGGSILCHKPLYCSRFWLPPAARSALARPQRQAETQRSAYLDIAISLPPGQRRATGRDHLRTCGVARQAGSQHRTWRLCYRRLGMLLRAPLRVTAFAAWHFGVVARLLPVYARGSIHHASRSWARICALPSSPAAGASMPSRTVLNRTVPALRTGGAKTTSVEDAMTLSSLRGGAGILQRFTFLRRAVFRLLRGCLCACRTTCTCRLSELPPPLPGRLAASRRHPVHIKARF